jgi:predicted transcriptional regulator
MKALFGNKTALNVLLYITNFGEGYSKQIAKNFGLSLSMVQNQLKRLEFGGILVSKKLGKTRVFLFNPRYPFLKELKVLQS